MTDFDRSKYNYPVTVQERKQLIAWLDGHPCFTAPIRNDGSEGLDGEPDHQEYVPHNMFHEQLYIMWTWVDPVTKMVEDDQERNTSFEVWLEHGCVHDLTNDDFTPDSEWDKYTCSHDWDLDCGGPNLDEALIELAMRVKHFYGEYDTEDPQAFVEWHRTHEHGVLK